VKDFAKESYCQILLIWHYFTDSGFPRRRNHLSTLLPSSSWSKKLRICRWNLDSKIK